NRALRWVVVDELPVFRHRYHFLHDHRRGAGRYGSACENARRLSGLQSLARLVAGSNALHNLPAVARIVIDGIAVHRAVIKGGHIVLHQNVARQHPLVQLLKRYALFTMQGGVGLQQVVQGNVIIKQLGHSRWRNSAVRNLTDRKIHTSRFCKASISLILEKARASLKSTAAQRLAWSQVCSRRSLPSSSWGNRLSNMPGRNMNTP